MNKKLLFTLTLGLLTLISTADAWRGRDWGYGGWGRGYAIGAGVGAAGGIIGSAITADAIKKSSPGYWEYKADKEAREAQEDQARREARAERRGYRYYDDDYYRY